MTARTFLHRRRTTRGFLVAAALLTCAIAQGQTPLAPVLTAIDGVALPPPPPSSPPGAVPLSWNDAAFVSMTNSGRLTLSSGQSRSGLSIDDDSGLPAISCNGSCNLERIRIQAREGVRCSSGTINMSWLYVAATGTGSDHADGLQCYSPNSTGTVTVKNSTFKTGGASTAGYFSADNWRGAHIFENVLFWGGNHGLRINVDGGSSARLKNVYFVRNSFNFGAFQIDVPILQWENVRWVTIENGQMVVGDSIPQPR